MRILVIAASKHGATAEIADGIAGKFRESDLDVEIHTPDSVDSLDGYDAVVIGSAVYAGQWMALRMYQAVDPSWRAAAAAERAGDLRTARSVAT